MADHLDYTAWTIIGTSNLDPERAMSGAEVTSIASSAVSAGLAMFAIGLALFLLNWSSDSSVRASASADRIDWTVKQLLGSVDQLRAGPRLKGSGRSSQ